MVSCFLSPVRVGGGLLVRLDVVVAGALLLLMVVKLLLICDPLATVVVLWAKGEKV